MTQITILGKLPDIERFVQDRPGDYNIYRPASYDWRGNMRWLADAVQRGDAFLILPGEYTGQYKLELIALMSMIKSRKAGE